MIRKVDTGFPKGSCANDSGAERAGPFVIHQFVMWALCSACLNIFTIASLMS
jgi:hypothetical protein